MASENVLEFTDSSFEGEVLNSEIPTMVDFGAEWCMPCKMQAPTIEELADDYAGRFKIGEIDTDSNRQVAIKLGISAIPTVIIFNGGQMVKKFVGLQSKNDLKAAIEEILA